MAYFCEWYTAESKAMQWLPTARAEHRKEMSPGKVAASPAGAADAVPWFAVKFRHRQLAVQDIPINKPGF